MPLQELDRLNNTSLLDQVINELVSTVFENNEDAGRRLSTWKKRLLELLNDYKCVLQSDDLVKLTELLSGVAVSTRSKKAIDKYIVEWARSFAEPRLTFDIVTSLKLRRKFPSWMKGSIEDLEFIMGNLVKGPSEVKEDVELLTPIQRQREPGSIPEFAALAMHIKTALNKNPGLKKLLIPIRSEDGSWQLIIIEPHKKGIEALLWAAGKSTTQQLLESENYQLMRDAACLIDPHAKTRVHAAGRLNYQLNNTGLNSIYTFDCVLQKILKRFPTNRLSRALCDIRDSMYSDDTRENIVRFMEQKDPSLLRIQPQCVKLPNRVAPQVAGPGVALQVARAAQPTTNAQGETIEAIEPLRRERIELVHRLSFTANIGGNDVQDKGKQPMPAAAAPGKSRR